MEFIKVENLSFTYPGADKPALKNINLSINPGEYICLCGESGSGKTTLLRHFKSSLTPYGTREGQILFEGEPIDSVSEYRQSQNIAFVMQDPDGQLVTDKVWHELAFTMENIGTPQKEMSRAVGEIANYFGIQNWYRRDTAKLSGGQKQILNLASALTLHSDLLILDEPTSQLDPIAAENFLNTIYKLNRDLGITVIITEQRLENVIPFASRVFVMEAGEIIAGERPSCLPASLREHKSGMIYSLPAPMYVHCKLNAPATCPLNIRDGREFLSEYIGERKITNPHIENACEINGKEPVAELKNVYFRYEKNSEDILVHTDFSMESGTIHAIVGGNGSGKTTLLKIIAGILKPYEGSVKIFGKNIAKVKKERLFSECVAMMPQDPKYLFCKASVSEELNEMVKGDSELVERVIALCRLENLLKANPLDLSGGEQQRLALSKLLLIKPKLLLLDEPTKGLDNEYKLTLAALLKTLKREGVSTLFVTHDIEFCAKCADNVSMVFDGGIICTDSARNFFSENTFYTTGANKMSRKFFDNAITGDDILSLLKKNFPAEHENEK